MGSLALSSVLIRAVCRARLIATQYTSFAWSCSSSRHQRARARRSYPGCCGRILDALHPILAAWQLETGGKGLVIPPLRSDGEKIDKHTPGKYLRPVLKELGWKAVAEYRDAWYAATRHTFASHWVMAGASIEKLKEVLGHYSVVVTERYAHLKPELFTAEDLGTLSLDFAPVLTPPIARVPSGMT